MKKRKFKLTAKEEQRRLGEKLYRRYLKDNANNLELMAFVELVEHIVKGNKIN